jgi:hypothetical protein
VPELWIPGMAGPHDDFVARLHRQIERFIAERALQQAFVEVELRDGERFSLHSISPEPGFGYITLTPYPDEEERPWRSGESNEPVPPEALIVPIAAISRIMLDDAAEKEPGFGFSLPSPGAG